MLQDNLIKFFEESFKEHSDAPAITDYFTSEVFTYYTLAPNCTCFSTHAV